jgi:dolichol-phosphate mannosyltransferase
MSKELTVNAADFIRALVVVPTYNERENVRPLCRRILRQGRALEVLVVDDNSPDGTAEQVRQIRAESDRVHLLERRDKLGLGTAYIAGFRWGLQRNYERLIQMDADFSHPPERLPAMLEKSRRCEVVLGSRYVPGGGWERWPRRRLIFSATANRLTRALLHLPARDCTAGFRCFRATALRQIPLENVRASGYAFQEEMLWQCTGRGWRICEVPISFRQRRRGRSKISLWEVLAALRVLVRLMFTPQGQKRKKDSTAS